MIESQIPKKILLVRFIPAFFVLLAIFYSPLTRTFISVMKNLVFKFIRRLKIIATLKGIILILVLVVLSLIAAYLINFKSANISEDPAHWGQFGDYFGMIINLAGTFAVFILSYLVFKGQKERDKWEKEIQELNETPILIFAADNNVYDKCLNVGKGSAHNVVIGKIGFNGNKTVIKSYSIPPNCYLKINWENDPNELFAYSESINGRKYLVKCVDDINSQLIKGSIEILNNPHKATVNWLINNAVRHTGISLRMIES